MNCSANLKTGVVLHCIAVTPLSPPTWGMGIVRMSASSLFCLTLPCFALLCLPPLPKGLLLNGIEVGAACLFALRSPGRIFT